MSKLIIALATAGILSAGSCIWRAEAATMTDDKALAPLTKSYTAAERLPIGEDMIAAPIGEAIMVTATLITASATIGHILITATFTAPMAITAMAGGQVLRSVSGVAGVGATNSLPQAIIDRQEHDIIIAC